MDTIVMKFGGSSVADNKNLRLVANKIIDLYDKNNNIVVILSAQGKTTDKLIKEAHELSKNTKDREMDMLLSSGEQMSIAKLSILLNEMGYNSISLTGWQAGILTNKTNQNATIKNIDTTRIKSAIAISAALNAKECYVFSDVDGVYTADPNKIEQAKKLTAISYNEMMEISSEGAKVLHNRCAEIGDKFKIPIITKSTFNNKAGTIITDIIEENTIKSVVKKDISRISIIGNGIIRNLDFIHKVLNLIAIEKLDLLEMNISESKISINFKNILSDDVLDKFHRISIELKEAEISKN